MRQQEAARQAYRAERAASADEMTIGQRLALLNIGETLPADDPLALAGTAIIGVVADEYSISPELVADQVWYTIKLLRDRGLDADAFELLGLVHNAHVPGESGAASPATILGAYATFRTNGMSHDEAATIVESLADGFRQ